MAETNYMLQKNDDDKYLKLSEFDGQGGGEQGESNYNSKIITVIPIANYKILNNVVLTDSNSKSATIDVDGVSTECFELTDDKLTEINTTLAKQGKGLNFNSSTSQLEFRVVGVGSDGQTHVETGGNAVSEVIGASGLPFSTDFNFKEITHIYIIGITSAELEKVTIEFNDTYYVDETLPNDCIIQYLEMRDMSTTNDFSISKLDNDSVNIKGIQLTSDDSKLFFMVYELLD